MLNYWILGEYLLIILGLISAVFLVKSLLRFFHSLAMQVSFYIVSNEADVNQRAATQYEMLLEHVKLRELSVRHILYSTLAIAVIIFLRYVLEVAHANV